MPRVRMKVELAAPDFLVLRDEIDQASASGSRPEVETCGRQAHRRKMARDALDLAAGSSRAAPRIERRAPCRWRSPRREQPVGKTGRSLERVAEGMPEIEQRTVAGFALVAADDRSLHAAAHGDGVLARRRPRKNRASTPRASRRRPRRKSAHISRPPHIPRGIVVVASYPAASVSAMDQDRLMKRADQFLP